MSPKPGKTFCARTGDAKLNAEHGPGRWGGHSAAGARVPVLEGQGSGRRCEAAEKLLVVLVAQGPRGPAQRAGDPKSTIPGTFPKSPTVIPRILPH